MEYMNKVQVARFGLTWLPACARIYNNNANEYKRSSSSKLNFSEFDAFFTGIKFGLVLSNVKRLE